MERSDVFFFDILLLMRFLNFSSKRFVVFLVTIFLKSEDVDYLLRQSNVSATVLIAVYQLSNYYLLFNWYESSPSVRYGIPSFMKYGVSLHREQGYSTRWRRYSMTLYILSPFLEYRRSLFVRRTSDCPSMRQSTLSPCFH